jgi:hypothetical protein
MNGKSWYDYVTRTLAEDGLPRRQAYKYGILAGVGVAVASVADYIHALSTGQYDSIVLLTIERAVFLWFGIGILLEGWNVPFFEVCMKWPTDFAWKILRYWAKKIP